MNNVQRMKAAIDSSRERTAVSADLRAFDRTA